MSVPLKIVIGAEQTPQFQSAIAQIEDRASRINTAQNRARLEALAIMRGQAVVTNAIAIGQSRVAKEMTQVTRQVERQAGFMTSLKAAFTGGVIARGGAVGSFGSLAGAGFTGGAFGGFVGAGLAMAVTGFISAIKQMTLGAIQAADAMSDTAEILGVRRSDVLALQEASVKSGVSSRVAMQSAATLARMRASALSGDQDAIDLFQNFGVTKEMLSSKATALDIAAKVRESLGRGGATARDDQALEKLFGQMPRRFLHILKNMPTDGRDFEPELKKLDDAASKIEGVGLRVRRVVTSILGTAFDIYDGRLDDALLAIQVGKLTGTNKGMTLPEAMRRLREAQPEVEESTGVEGERTAGFWTPRRRPEKQWIWHSFDLDSGGMSRLGLYGSRGQEMLARAGLNIQRSMLDTLRAIDRTLSQSPMLKETLTP